MDHSIQQIYDKAAKRYETWGIGVDMCAAMVSSRKELDAMLPYGYMLGRPWQQLRWPASAALGVRVGETELFQNLDFDAFHFFRFGLVLVVVTLCVQHAMHNKMGRMVEHGLLLLGGFTFQYIGAQDDVRLRDFAVFVFGIGKGQHISGVILATIVTIEGLSLGGIDKADRQFGRRKQGGCDPAPDLRARYGVFQAWIGVLDGQREFIFLHNVAWLTVSDPG